MATEFIYEILVRGDATGITAAHIQRGRVVTDEDGDTQTKIGKPEPLALADIESVFGSENARLITQIADLQSGAEAGRSELLAQKTETATAKSEHEDTKRRLNDALAKLADAESRIESLNEAAKPHVCNH
jgi:hypothetical protein